MKKYLLPENGTYYKANLHMHTVVSDGRMTPEETKELFLKNGYSIVAFTDHDVIAPHHDLTDENFLALTSFETYFNTELFGVMDYGFVQTYHLNFLAKDPDNVVCPAFSERYVERAHSLKYVTEEMKKYDYDREYNVQYMNKIIKEANEAGFLVTYNHPVWSLQNYNDYIGLKGLWGVEVFNSGCYSNGYEETANAYQDIARTGERIVPVCADDAHGREQCCHAWTMLKAEKLDYVSVIRAMEKGDCYSSTGPEIKELYIEEGAVVIKTSPCEKIAFISERRHCGAYHATGEPLTEARFAIEPFLKNSDTDELEFTSPFIRFEVTDGRGKKAYTRAYFLEELQ